MYPTRINLTTTRRCNLNCIHCYVNHDKVPVSHGWEMSMDLFDYSMRQAVECFQHIGLSNLGEFLSDKQFDERAALFKKYMNSKEDVWFDQVTNATLLDEEHLAPLAGLKNPVLYIFSLDAIDPLISYAIRPPGLAGQAAENIRTIRATHTRLGMKSPEIAISVTLLKRNLLDGFNLINFAREVGCAIYFRHVMGQGLTVNNDESLFRVPAFSNRMLKKFKQYGESLGVKVLFEPFFAESEEDIGLYFQERKTQTPCRMFTEKYTSKIDINGNYTCCCNLDRVLGNIQEVPLTSLADHSDNFITSFLGKPISPCTLCRGRQVQQSFIHEPSVFDLDIREDERDYNPDINLEEHGFFNWLDEVDQKKAGTLLRDHWNKLFGAKPAKTMITSLPKSQSFNPQPQNLITEEHVSKQQRTEEAIIHWKRGGYTAALNILEKLLREFPSDPQVRNQLNAIYAEVGIPLIQ